MLLKTIWKNTDWFVNHLNNKYNISSTAICNDLIFANIHVFFVTEILLKVALITITLTPSYRALYLIGSDYWCLTLYYGSWFYWYRKLKYQKKITDLPKVTDKFLSHKFVHLTTSENQTYNLSGDRHWFYKFLSKYIVPYYSWPYRHPKLDVGIGSWDFNMSLSIILKLQWNLE